MTVKWSPHAKQLLCEIIFTIEDAFSTEDALRWEDVLRKNANGLADCPLSCPTIPLICFREVPPNPERLRQLIVKPYRIVYEIIGDEVHVLSIRHGRMLVALDDTYWN